MKTIRVSDEAHSYIEALALYLTLHKREKHNLKDAIDFLVEEHEKRKALEA